MTADSHGPDDNPAKQVRWASDVHQMFVSQGDKMAQDRNYSPRLTRGHEEFRLTGPFQAA